MNLKEEEGNMDRRKMAAASKQPKETLIISFVTTIAVRGRRTNIGCQKCQNSAE
jgi:hypothetical protein